MYRYACMLAPRDHTYMTSKRKEWVLKFVTCLRILLVLSNRSIVQLFIFWQLYKCIILHSLNHRYEHRKKTFLIIEKKKNRYERCSRLTKKEIARWQSIVLVLLLKSLNKLDILSQCLDCRFRQVNKYPRQHW